jgi:tetratricopeptide (TPR) repeat protein
MLTLLALLLAAGETRVDRFERCGRLQTSDPSAGLACAKRWVAADASERLARTSEAQAYAALKDWRAAAAGFERAAAMPDLRNDGDTTALWTSAGEAWLAAGEPVRALAAFDRVPAAGTLDAREQGELYLDRARALVAKGDAEAARTDLDQALAKVPADPLAWLLSATLARRAADQPRAAKDIAEALRLAPDDAAVQLEAGNIAALAGDEAGAKARWGDAARLQPDGPSGRAAKAALAQFGIAAGAGTPPR